MSMVHLLAHRPSHGEVQARQTVADLYNQTGSGETLWWSRIKRAQAIRSRQPLRLHELSAPLPFCHVHHMVCPAGHAPSASRIGQNRKQSKRVQWSDSAAYPGFKRLEPIGSIVAVFATHNLPFG